MTTLLRRFGCATGLAVCLFGLSRPLLASEAPFDPCATPQSHPWFCALEEVPLAEGWRVDALRLQPPRLQVLLAHATETSVGVDLLALKDTNLPAIATSRCFALRLRTRGATPEALARSSQRLAKELTQLEADRPCPSVWEALHSTIAPKAPTEDMRPTAIFRSWLGVPLTQFTSAWLLTTALLGLGLLAILRTRAPPEPTARREKPALNSAHKVALLLTALVALSTRGAGIDEFVLNADEYACLLDVYSTEEILAGDDDSLLHPPLFRLVSLAHVSMWPGQDFPPRWWWRLPSLLFGLLSVWLAYLIGQRLSGPTLGTGCAALTACHAELVYVSNLAKPYALTTALVLLTLYASLRAHSPGTSGWRSTRWWALAAVSAAATAWTDYVALMGLTSLALLLALWPSATRRDKWGLAGATGFAALASMPLVPLFLSGHRYYLLRQKVAEGQLNAAQWPAGFPQSPPLAPDMALGGQGPLDALVGIAEATVGYWPGEVFAVGALVLAIAPMGRTAPAPTRRLTAWTALLALSLLALSQFAYLRGQNISFAAAVVQLALASAIWIACRKRRRWLFPVTLLGLCLLQGPPLSALYQNSKSNVTGDLCFGYDCHAVLDEVSTLPQGSTVLLDDHASLECLGVELLDGDPSFIPRTVHERPPVLHAQHVTLTTRGAEAEQGCGSGDKNCLYVLLRHGRKTPHQPIPSECVRRASTRDYDVWRCTQ